MSMLKDLICTEDDGALSFGDYLLEKKTKLDNFEYNGDIYKVKTFSDITKLEKNGMFVYESVPGTTVGSLLMEEDGITFNVSGKKDTQITVELEEDTDYNLLIHGKDTGVFKTNLSGKLSFSVEFEGDDQVKVEIIRA